MTVHRNYCNVHLNRFVKDSTTHDIGRRSVLSSATAGLSLLYGARAADALADRPSASERTVESAGGTTSLSLARSRARTVVGTPVSFRATGGTGSYEWMVHAAPGRSEADVHDPTGRVTSLRPDAPGRYEVAVTDGAETALTPFTVTPRSDLIERFAPRLHFHADTAYRPTRLEALVHNASLESNGETVTTDPTVFDLEGRDDAHYLELEGRESEYPEYQEAYPPTIYANVTDETTFRGEKYAAVTYWFVYTYDPKHGFARFGAHQADVESLVVLVDDEGEGAYVAPAAHGAMTIRPFDQAVPDGTHVAVYPEHKSHATYLRDSSAYDGDGFQVYSHWDDPDADCGDVDPFLSAFHSEWTGSAERWSHDGAVGTEYQLVELTGDEVWATYEGGLAADPGSITPPHQRQQYADPGGRMEDRGCPDHEQVSGRIEYEDHSLEADRATVTVTVSNDGGKPHPFWLSVAGPADGEHHGHERARVGTANPRPLIEGRRRSVTLELESPDPDRKLTVQLWLHSPEVRRDRDLEDVTAAFTLGNDDSSLFD